jgi:hypothetical protein
MRLFQVVWNGRIPENDSRIDITEQLDIIDPVVTPVNTLSRGLRLITTNGDIIFPCASCLSRKITDTISYSSLDLMSRGGKAMINASVHILCDGTIGHNGDQGCSIVLYVDYPE